MCGYNIRRVLRPTIQTPHQFMGRYWQNKDLRKNFRGAFDELRPALKERAPSLAQRLIDGVP